MTRPLAFALLAAGLASAASRADVEVAPPPREVRPDGSRDPAPMPEATPKEDPLAVVERIIKNSKAVGDKLAMTDTGADTRKTQEKILKDIDALLNQDDPPPKSDMNDMNKDMNDGMGGGKDNKDMKDMNDGMGGGKDQKKDMNDGMGGGKDKQDGMGGMGGGKDKKDGPSGKQPMGGGGMGGMDDQPMGGGDQPKERRPRQGGGQKQETQPKDPGKGGGGANDKQQPKGGVPKEPPKNPGGGGTPDQKGNPPPLLPFEEEVAKGVWGHLPDKLRQQASQYYKQEFMPRYTELLKLYYSSLSEKK